MKTIVTVVVGSILAATTLFGQNMVVQSLTLPNGANRVTLTSPSLTADVSAPILTNFTGWALGGNSLVGPSSSSNQLGTSDAVDVQLISNNVPRLVLSGSAATVTAPNQTNLRFVESGGSDYVAFVAPSAITTSATYTLPAANPAVAGHVLAAAAAPAPSTSAATLEWVAPSGGGGGAVTYVVTGADVTSASGVFVTGMSVAVAANRTYLVEATFTMSTTGAAADPRFKFVGPTGATMTHGFSATLSDITAANNGSIAGYVATIDTPHSLNIITDNHRGLVFVTGVLTTSATAGNLTFQFNRNGGGSTITLFAGSSLKITDVTP